MRKNNKIKVVGLQRSGTTWIEKYLQTNLSGAYIFDGGYPFWKHEVFNRIHHLNFCWNVTNRDGNLLNLSPRDFPAFGGMWEMEYPGKLNETDWNSGKLINKMEGSFSELNKIDYVILVTKNPYTWIRSLTKPRPNDNKIYQDILSRIPTLKFRHAIPYWCHWNTEWIENMDMHIRYEDMLLDPESILDMIDINHVKVGMNDEVEEIKDHIENTLPTTRSFTEEERNFYLTPPYGLSDKDINNINKFLDQTIVNLLGYEVL